VGICSEANRKYLEKKKDRRSCIATDKAFIVPVSRPARGDPIPQGATAGWTAWLNENWQTKVGAAI